MFFKLIPAILLTPLLITYSIVGVIIGITVVPFVVVYAEITKAPTLPKLFQAWDNDEDGYHGCKRGDKNFYSYNRARVGLFNRWWKSIYWTCIRNPFHNGTLWVGLNLDDIGEIIEIGNFENKQHLNIEVKNKGTIKQAVYAKYKSIWVYQFIYVRQIGSDRFIYLLFGWKLGVWLDTHRDAPNVAKHKYRAFGMQCQVRSNSKYQEKWNEE